MQGVETALSLRVRSRVEELREAEKRAQEEIGKRPSCSIEWSQGQGGRAWCDLGAGHPRIARVPVGDAFIERCVCFPEPEVDPQRARLYQGCDPAATECPIPP